jgi:hypothetical protein
MQTIETHKLFDLPTRARGVASQTTFKFPSFKFPRSKNMNTRTKLILTCAALLLTITATTPSARANLLVDPGFEANPLNTDAYVINTPNPMNPGVWGVEMATITGVDGGVTPFQGVKMLRMTDDFQTATQGFQAIDVTSDAALIDSGGATVNMSALFTADKNTPAAIGAVYVSFFTTSNYASLTTYIGNSLTLDNSNLTWQTISTSGPIPAGTRWLLSQVAYNDASLVGNPGYVDAADLTITPEPGTMLLLLSGMVGLLCYARRKRK